MYMYRIFCNAFIYVANNVVDDDVFLIFPFNEQPDQSNNSLKNLCA